MAFIPFGDNVERIAGKVGAASAQPWHRAVDLLQHEKLQEIERRNALKNKNAEMQNFVEQAKKAGYSEEMINAMSPHRPEDRLKALQFTPNLIQAKHIEKQLEAVRALKQAYTEGQGMQQGQQQPEAKPQQQGFMQSLAPQQQMQQQPGGQQQSPTGAQSEPAMQNEALGFAGMKPQAQTGVPGVPQGGQVGANPFDQIENELMNKLQNTLTFKDPRLKLQEEALAQKQANADRELEHKKLVHALKVAGPEINKINKDANAAKKNIIRLDRMQQLAETGKLNHPFFAKIMRKIGQNWMLTPESQEYEKHEISFLDNAKELFGGRVTNFEAQTFLRSIPSLQQSPEGRALVTHNLRIMEEAKIARKNAYDEELKKNNGVPTWDIVQNADQMAAPEINQLYNKLMLTREDDNFSVTGFIKELPDPKDAGKNIYRDPDTGEAFQSNGTSYDKMINQGGLWVKAPDGKK